MASVVMYNSEVYGLKEAEGEKFNNMLEVIEATSGDLGVSQASSDSRGQSTSAHAIFLPDDH